MRCYYEELGVDRDSNESDIKTAYRKLALRWHPDKNPDSLAEAKERFQLIQQAYEVLSDAQERAWYDNHREQILRGKNSEYSENCLDVFQYFSSSCYKGYGNDAQGFYSVYCDVFNNIGGEDIEFMDTDDELVIPEFGNADSSYEDVVGPFYAYWLSYSTKKTYEWLCPYDVREIKERFILRKVEKEMKKIVQNARKERNEEVRNLVSFVRKRDRRVQAYRRVLEERAEANRQKQEEKRKEQLRQRQEQLAAVRANKVVNDGYEEQLRQLEQQYGSESDDYTDEDDDDEFDDDDENDAAATAESDDNADESELELEYVDDLYCVACNKSFKNAKARANHEESKKHRDNVERLRQQMETEEQEFSKQNEAEDGLEKLQLNDNHETDENDQAELASDENTTTQTLSKRNKKSKKSKKAAPKVLVNSEDDDSDVDSAVQPVDFQAPVSNSDDNDVDDWSNSKKSAKKTKSKKSAASKQKTDAESRPTTTELKPPQPQSKAALTAAAGSDDEAAVPGQHTCVTCKLVFDSKNKLFAHLKKTNHGVYIPKAKPKVEGKPPGKAKGKRK